MLQTFPNPAPLSKLAAWCRGARKELWNGLGLLLVAISGCWLLLFDELCGEWKINPQYNYGWLVPLLGAVLIYMRWPDRPSAVPPESGRWTAVAGAGLLALLLPVRITLEANPEWRLLYWLHGFEVLGLSCCLLYRLGGWPWVQFFAFPISFMLIAIPWPMEWETAIIQGLMRQVAGWTVAVVDCFGIPAIAHGNVVEVSAGWVGINEACSGVRSLQSALMVSLFLGELYRFGRGRRGTLVLLSIVFVLLANLVRTTFLVWAAATRGLEIMESWHNTAGSLVMVVVLLGLLGLAVLIKPRTTKAHALNPENSLVLPPVHAWVGTIIITWIAVVIVATEWWYQAHEVNLQVNQRWTVAWPAQSPDFKQTDLPEESLAILRCSSSQSACWQDDSGNRCSAFFLRWEPCKNSAQLAKGHRPEVCFPASGAKLVDDFGTVPVTADGIGLTFTHQTFQSGSHLLQVFFCLWSDRTSTVEKALREDISQASRIDAVLAGRRHLGQQVLEIVLEGPENREEAQALFQTQVAFLIKKV